MIGAIVLLSFIAATQAQTWNLFTDAAGETRFRLRAGNNEIVLASEGYSDKTGAVAGIGSVRMNAMDANNFEVKETTAGGKWYFVLKAGNNQVIGTSEVYVSKSNAEAGVTAAMTAATTAQTVKDLTVASANNADAGVFEIFQDAGDQYRFRLKAGNGEPILASEAYTTKSGALNGVDSVRTNSELLGQYELLTATNGQFYFNLKSPNGQVIGTSETYSSTGARSIGQFAVLGGAPTAPIVDLTLGAPAERKSSFVLYRSLSGEFRWNLRAKNYQTILVSEGYTSKSSAQNGIASVKTNSPMDARFVKLTASNGKFYFNLRAGNNQVIGTSELYNSEAARDNGIASVKANAPDAIIIDKVVPGVPSARYEIFRDRPTGTKFYFRLKAANSETILSSEQYTDKAGAQNGIASVKVNGILAERFEKKVDAKGNPRFNLKAGNGQVIGTSESYSSAAARDAGIEAVMRVAADAEIKEIAWVAPPPTPAPATTTMPEPTPAPTPMPTPMAGVECTTYTANGCGVCVDNSDSAHKACDWCGDNTCKDQGTCTGAAITAFGATCPTDPPTTQQPTQPPLAETTDDVIPTFTLFGPVTTANTEGQVTDTGASALMCSLAVLALAAIAQL